jgi:hypothetical protein
MARCDGDALGHAKGMHPGYPTGVFGVSWGTVNDRASVSHSQGQPESKELRCHGCGKLLAEKAACGTVIVCSRCKTRNEAD